MVFHAAEFLTEKSASYLALFVAYVVDYSGQITDA